MFSCSTDCLLDVPDITVHANCDTCLAINLGLFNIGEYDEFVFVIKNYDYTESSYAFMFRANKADIDEHGEIFFNIDPDSSKNIKPSAFYTFAVLVNALNYNEPTEYKKLTKNGKVIVEYGAQDLLQPEPIEQKSPYNAIISARIEPTDDEGYGIVKGALVDARIECCLEEA